MRTVTATPCVNCGKLLNAATTLRREAAPEPGDLSICFYCGHLAVFDDGLRLREPTSEEAHTIAADPDMLQLQQARLAAAMEIYVKSSKGRTNE